MKRIYILSCFILATVFNAVSSEMPAWKITPFTGTDYVRIVVDEGFRTSVSSSFKVVIREISSKKIFWQGPVNAAPAVSTGKKRLAFTVKGLKPELWTPSSPHLYEISLQQYDKGVLKNELKERAGFRSFERRGGNLYLNNKPIFLRGIAINPPNRGIPEELETSRGFALEYVKFMKSINVNIIRIPDDETWFDVCDELGMMVFGGNYSGKVAGGEKVEATETVSDETDGGFPRDFDKGVSWYENEKLGSIAHHPSLMVYAMTNETPFAGKRAQQWEKFLSYAFDKLKQWDETRVYIANAGYGYGKAGDICDIHRYWGWYYNSPYTFLNIRDNAAIIPFPKKDQPVTFTECVGNYTGPDGRYNLTPWHKNPSSQLAWTGHERQDLQAQLADEHQSFTLRQATESFRQLRAINPDLSGVFPFTILFYNWNTIRKFADMQPKPVTKQVRISYQPVLLSWECWTSNVFAGAVVKPIAHIINDSDDFDDLKNNRLTYELRDKTHTIVYSASVPLPDIPYYGTVQRQLEINVPEHLIAGEYVLSGKIESNGKIVSENFFRFFIADKGFAGSFSSVAPVLLYDKNGSTKKAFSELNIKYKDVRSLGDLAGNSILVIGENSADKALSESAQKIKKFIMAGGRVLSLKQDSTHLENINTLLAGRLGNENVDIDDPQYPVVTKSPRTGYYVNPERSAHPVFSGISRSNLRVWSDYTGWTARSSGLPQIRPVTDGFTLLNSDDVVFTSILANYGSGLRGIALAEQFSGKGSVLLCGLDLANRVRIDPVAARVFMNLVNYTASSYGHEVYQLITAPVIWGEYETEKGIVTDIYSGFLVNSTPRLPASFTGGILVTKEGYQLAGGNRSGFNSRPGIQYVANGRRPFGPYVHSFGGQPQITDKNSVAGNATFWCRIPEWQNTSHSVIWNPGDEPLTIKITVNGLPEVSRTIEPGKKVVVECPVDSPDVRMNFSGDRRLVVLETAFLKKEL